MKLERVVRKCCATYRPDGPEQAMRVATHTAARPSSVDWTSALRTRERTLVRVGGSRLGQHEGVRIITWV